MALGRGVLPFLVTIAVVAGAFYALMDRDEGRDDRAGDPSFDAAEPVDPVRDGEPAGSTAGPEADASRAPEALADDRGQDAAPATEGEAEVPATAPGEAMVRSRIRPPPAATASEERAVAGRTEAREPAAPTPAWEPGERATAGIVPDAPVGVRERAAGGVTPSPSVSDREPEPQGAPAGREPAAAPAMRPPPAEARAPQDEPETRGTAEREPSQVVGTQRGASPPGTTEPSPAVPRGEAADDGGAGDGRTVAFPQSSGTAGAVDEPEESAWWPSDFGIDEIRRTFARLFGEEEPAFATDQPASGPRGAEAGAAPPSGPPAAENDPPIKSKSEATIRQALRAMTTQEEPEPAAGPAGAERPTFDIVRVEPDGSAVIAGRAPPGTEVDVLAGDDVIDRVTADRTGSWVSVPAAPLAAGDQTLSLAALKGDGTRVRSEDVVVVAVRAAAASSPVREREAAAQTPGQVLRGEAPPPQPPDVLPAAAPAEEPLAVLLPRDGEGRGRILQAPGRISSDGSLALMVLDYDRAGRVQITGEAPPGATIRIYVDNQPAGEAVADADGSWTTVLDDRLGAGTYTLRLDQLDDRGRPVARLETPFTRIDKPPREGDVAVDYVIVQPGNSLWRIARRIAGRGMAYVHIYDANRAQIRDPDLIYPGQVFKVPRVLGEAG